MKKETGAPAPTYFTDQHAQSMLLRDYIAAKAMRIMWDAYDKGYCGLNDKDEPNVKTIAEGAYQIADAMLRARETV